jgi:hypothetical protein
MNRIVIAFATITFSCFASMPNGASAQQVQQIQQVQQVQPVSASTHVDPITARGAEQDVMVTPNTTAVGQSAVRSRGSATHFGISAPTSQGSSPATRFGLSAPGCSGCGHQSAENNVVAPRTRLSSKPHVFPAPPAAAAEDETPKSGSSLRHSSGFATADLGTARRKQPNRDWNSLRTESPSQRMKLKIGRNSHRPHSAISGYEKSKTLLESGR